MNKRGKLLKDLSGFKHQNYVVLKREKNPNGARVDWKCQCNCGRIFYENSPRIINGNRHSCGCHKSQRAGEDSKTYYVWHQMRQRCYNPKNPAYPKYGGRGIVLCERWQKYDNFIEDMGAKPNGLTIERIDNNKGYSPENCKWVTMKEQNNNKRNSVKVYFDGRLKTVSQWGEIFGLGKNKIWDLCKKFGPSLGVMKAAALNPNQKKA